MEQLELQNREVDGDNDPDEYDDEVGMGGPVDIEEGEATEETAVEDQ